MRKEYIQINNKKYEFQVGESVLHVAIRNNIDIPHFCYHEDLQTEARCRACLVKTIKDDKIVTSCTLSAVHGLKISTKGRILERLRKENMELLLADHKKNCRNCKSNYFCKTSEEMKKYKITGEKYHRQKTGEPIHKMATAAQIDSNVCIACNKCVQICDRIGIGYLELTDGGSKTHSTHKNIPNIDCIYCGQCSVHCPANAIHEQSQIEEVEAALKDKSKIVIAQAAPSIRTSIGEEFGCEPGKDLTGQMYTAMRKLGFDKVFDVSMGADITTVVEAKELVKRIKTGDHLPMFTSCCPGWVKFVEFYHPELIPNLATSRSPQIHAGAAYKTWWAKKEKINPKNIVVVSIMPCTSKKYEAKNSELKVEGNYPVDNVLTTREFAILLKKNNINLPKLTPSKVDLHGEYSGAAVIYGASGGVAESALRTAYFDFTKTELENIEFEKVRGIEGIKKTEVKIGNRVIKVAVVTTMKNVRLIIGELKENPRAYDYIEVMACPGGCIGGGGQPIPTTDNIVKERTKGLYTIDKKSKVRKAHLNPVAEDFFKSYIGKQTKEKQSEILYRTYSQKKKFR